MIGERMRSHAVEVPDSISLQKKKNELQAKNRMISDKIKCRK